jgi:hypothetical protein
MHRQVGNAVMPLFNRVSGLYVHQVSGSVDFIIEWTDLSAPPYQGPIKY